MTVNEDPSLAYKNIKLYTDYNLDYYDSPLGRDSTGVAKPKCSKTLTGSRNLLEPILKKGVDCKCDSNSLVTDRNDSVASKDKSQYLQYKPCVSFDTVPISSPIKDYIIEKEYPSYDFPGVQIPPELYTMDEWYDTESGYATSDNSGYFIHNNYVTSDTPFEFGNGGNDSTNDRDNDNNNNNNNNSSSSVHGKRSPSPTRIKSQNALRQMQNTFKLSVNGKIVREDYPSRPMVDNDAMIINRAYGQWDTLWNRRRLQIDDRLLKKTKIFKYSDILFPDLSNDKKKPDDDQLNLPNGTNKEWELLTRRQKRRWLIMNEVVGYPTGPKTILCHISGRKHTWVGLDYTIMKLAQDTDHIVIVANLSKLRQFTNSSNSYTYSTGYNKRSNLQHHHNQYHTTTSAAAAITTHSSHHHRRHSSYTVALSDLNSRNKSVSRNEKIDTSNDTLASNDKIGVKLSKIKSMDPELSANKSCISDNEYEDEEDEDEIDPQWAYGYDRQIISDKLNDILLYISVLLSKHPKSIKVTVEIVIGKSVCILNDMVNIYMPDLFVMAKKKVTSEVRWHSVHLTDKFLKHSPVPVCVVFVKPMYQFEIDLAKQFSNDPTNESIPTAKGREDSISNKNKYSLEKLDKWILSSIESGSKIECPQTQPKMMKSMIEIALANDKNKNSHRKMDNGSGSHDMSTDTTKSRPVKASRTITIDNNNNDDDNNNNRKKKINSNKVNFASNNLGVPLTKTRTVSSTKPVKNWNTDKNSLRKIKSNTPDDVSRNHIHNSSNSSSSSSGGGGGFLSSLFKRRW